MRAASCLRMAPADALGFHQRHFHAFLRQFQRGGHAGETAADDGDVDTHIAFKAGMADVLIKGGAVIRMYALCCHTTDSVTKLMKSCGPPSPQHDYLQVLRNRHFSAIGKSHETIGRAILPDQSGMPCMESRQSCLPSAASEPDESIGCKPTVAIII